MKSDSPNLAIIEKHDVELTGKNDAVVIILTAIITDLVNFLNVGKNMDAAQVKQTIDVVLSDIYCRNLRPEDYKVISDRIKKGFYNRNGMFDRFDGNVFLLCVMDYCEEKTRLFIEQNEERHEYNKNKGVHPTIAKALSEIGRTIFDGAEAENKKRITEKLVNEFYNLWAKAPVKTPGPGYGMHIEYGGKVVSENEYIQIRLNQMHK